MPTKLNGRKYTWTKQALIGKGDAGEVYQVVSAEYPESAVLKCPLKVATGGTIVRQASQIETEGEILKLLDDGIFSDKRYHINAPLMIDESSEGSTQTGAYFIVSEQAKGVSLIDLIKNHQQGLQSVSRRFILKIASALFQLLDGIHSKRIVWNDVKAEHLFWNESQNTLMAIDWANGRIIPDDESDNIASLLFFDDTQQMINEMRVVFQNVSPDLLVDLAWPNKIEPGFGDEQVDALRRRTTFLENYYHYRVVEKRALEEVTTGKMKEISDLELLILTQNELSIMGEEVDHEKLIAKAEELLRVKLESGDIDSFYRGIALINSIAPDSDSRRWQILSQLLEFTGSLSHSKLTELAGYAFNSAWVDLYWQLKRLNFLDGANHELHNLMDLTRHLSLPNNYYEHEISAELLQLKDELNVEILRTQIQNEDTTNRTRLKLLQRQVEELLSNWDSLITLREWEAYVLTLESAIFDAKKLGLSINSWLIAWINGLKPLFRGLNAAWRMAELSQVRGIIHEWLVWCPAVDGLLEMDERISLLEQWLGNMMAGPEPSQSPMMFISELLEQKPQVEQYFDLPQWMKDLLDGLEKIKNAKNADDISAIHQQHALPMNWILQIGDLGVDGVEEDEKAPLTDAQKTILTHFYEALKSGKDVDGALEEIHVNLSWAFPAYRQLSQAFGIIFLPHSEQVEFRNIAIVPIEDQPNYRMAQKVLAWIKGWQEAVSKGKFNIDESLPDVYIDWQIIRDCLSAQEEWSKDITPILSSLKQDHWQSSIPTVEYSSPTTELFHCITALYSAGQVWLEICLKGVDKSHLELLMAHLDEARSYYQKFINQEDSSRPNQFLFAKYQVDISEQFQRIVRLRNLAARIYEAYLVISTREMLNTGFGATNAETLIFTLESLNDSIPQCEPTAQISIWKDEYEKVINCKDEGEFQQILADLDVKNPLFGWLQAKWQGFTE